jgi:hypothetical protein
MSNFQKKGSEVNVHLALSITKFFLQNRQTIFLPLRSFGTFPVAHPLKEAKSLAEVMDLTSRKRTFPRGTFGKEIVY